MLAALLDPALDVLRTLGPPALTAVVAVVATRAYMLRRGADGLIGDHDRRGRELNDELRRWIADRDRGVRQTMIELRRQAADRGISRGDVLIQAAGRIYHGVLQEFRAQFSAQRHEIDALLAAEGRAHQRRRRAIGHPPPRLWLTADASQILHTWRDRAQYDPAAPEIEPWFAELQRSVAPAGAAHDPQAEHARRQQPSSARAAA